MMYGTVETLEERIEHLFRLRELQDETGGFTAFITWSYQPEHTELGGAEATGVDYLRTLAIARSCSTTSTTCRRRGSRRAARSGSSAWPTAPTTWAA